MAIGGAVTEIVYALGAGSRLVAADSTSTWPDAAKALPRVGYMRALSAEGVLSARPQLLIATSDAGPATALAQIRGAGLPVTVLRNAHSFESLKANVRDAAGALGAEGEGAALERRLDEAWSKVRAEVERAGPGPRVLFVLAHAGNNMMVAGEGTSAEAMLRLAGARNALGGFKGYKPLTAEAVVGAQPQVVLTTREGIAALGGEDKLWRAPGLALTPAAARKRIVALDALYLLGFGPRLPEAVRELSERLRSPL